ncbi:MAG: hypothetical protein K0U29_06800 [Gammaproteobacteria bacterium]|nr:hypothetical protein [Gammaproteobacteria bacterium]MCH9744623.1 hypothetical protein [Gammaproteobacteria bacterium]
MKKTIITAAAIAALAISVGSYAAESQCTISVSANNQPLTAYNIANDAYAGDTSPALEHYDSKLFNGVTFEAISKESGYAYNVTVPFGHSKKIAVPCGNDDTNYNIFASLSGTGLVGSAPSFASTFQYLQRVNVNDTYRNVNITPFYNSANDWRAAGNH